MLALAALVVLAALVALVDLVALEVPLLQNALRISALECQHVLKVKSNEQGRTKRD